MKQGDPAERPNISVVDEDLATGVRGVIYALAAIDIDDQQEYRILCERGEDDTWRIYAWMHPTAPAAPLFKDGFDPMDGTPIELD